MKERNKLQEKSVDQGTKHTTKAKILRVLVLIYYLALVLPTSNVFNLNVAQVSKF